jgi:hypothetical protein
MAVVEFSRVSLFKRERAVEIVAASGTVRVTVNPKPAWFAMIFEAAVIIVVFVAFVLPAWASLTLLYRALLCWAAAGTVIAWFYQLSGSEVIELDAQKLAISKQILGWTRTREYPVNECRELEWLEQTGEGDTKGLQCKVGWRTVKFGDYISEDEAIEVLTAVQTNLPDVAQRMCTMQDPEKKHFTTLNLS